MKKGLFLAFTLLAASFTASASTIVQNLSLTPTFTNYNTASGPPNPAPLAFFLFDNSWGTLNSVTVDLASTMTGNVALQAGPSTVTFGNIVVDVTTNLSKPGSGLVLTSVFPTKTLNTSKTPIKLTNTIQNLGLPATSDNVSFFMNSGTNASDFVLFAANGGGSSFFNVDATNFLTCSNSGSGGTCNATITADAAVTVTYDYTVPSSGVPEPSTMALAGSAMVGLGLLLRRRVQR